MFGNHPQKYYLNNIENNQKKDILEIHKLIKNLNILML